jgi:hypothetical protein
MRSLTTAEIELFSTLTEEAPTTERYSDAIGQLVIDFGWHGRFLRDRGYAVPDDLLDWHRPDDDEFRLFGPVVSEVH